MKSIKRVNVGTVGHIDHGRVLQYTGRMGYSSDPRDYVSNMPSIVRYNNPFQPEWIYWWEGLIYVGGRVVHNLRIYDQVESPSAESALITTDSANKGHSDKYNRLQELLVSRMKMGAIGGKIMPTEVVMEVERLLTNSPMKINPIRIMHEYERDRRTVIPSRKSIQWAIEMTHWKDKDLFKILGMEQLSPEQLTKLRWERKDA